MEADELPEVELGMALSENDDLAHRQSCRTFREMSNSSAFSAKMRFKPLFSQSSSLTR